MDPFVTLNLPINCTDEEVREAYHRLLRRFPPETHPVQFQQINSAYTNLRTERERWAFFLFKRSNEQSPMEALEEFYQAPDHARPPGANPFQRLLTACAAPAKSKKKPGSNRSKK